MPHPHLPTETLDNIVDNLLDAGSLENCCLVSKSWVPRARKALFYHVTFRKAEDLKSWKNTFPDPSTSPAHYTKNLTVGCPQTATAIDEEEDHFLSTFCNILYLNVYLDIYETPSNIIERPQSQFIQRPAYRVFPASCIFKLMVLFPLLQELTTEKFEPDGDSECDGWPAANLQSMRSICLTSVEGIGLGPVLSRILTLPGGLRLSILDVTLHSKQDIELTAALVERCSALEFLYLRSKITGKSFSACIYIDN